VFESDSELFLGQMSSLQHSKFESVINTSWVPILHLFDFIYDLLVDILEQRENEGRPHILDPALEPDIIV